jgi:hypothetical protein
MQFMMLLGFSWRDNQLIGFLRRAAQALHAWKKELLLFRRGWPPFCKIERVEICLATANKYRTPVFALKICWFLSVAVFRPG